MSDNQKIEESAVDAANRIRSLEGFPSYMEQRAAANGAEIIIGCDGEKWHSWNGLTSWRGNPPAGTMIHGVRDLRGA